MSRPKIASSYLFYWISIVGRNGALSLHTYIHNLCHNQYKLSMQLRKKYTNKTDVAMQRKRNIAYSNFYFSHFYLIYRYIIQF